MSDVLLLVVITNREIQNPAHRLDTLNKKPRFDFYIGETLQRLLYLRHESGNKGIV
jgi:hypothetical protein